MRSAATAIERPGSSVTRVARRLDNQIGKELGGDPSISVRGQESAREKRIVQFVGIARLRT